MRKSKFIVIDGTDGAGKSTMARELVSYLQKKGLTVHHTREPGGTPFCERVREALLGFDTSNMSKPEKVDSDTELLLMFAMRNQHLKSKIIPALENDEWIVCERWTSSTFAYQGFARGLGTDKIIKMDDEFVTVSPDMTLIFDVSPDLSRERMGKRSELDYIEKEEISFFENVRKGYHLYAESCKEKCFVIDASQGMDEVKSEMLKTVVKESGLKKALAVEDSVHP